MARLINAFEQFFDSSGNPLVGGKLYFYQSGSSTIEKETFADVDESIGNSNPVLLGADGRSPNVFGSGSYRVILTNKDDVQILFRDPITGEGSNVFGADWNSLAIYSSGDVVRDDGQYWISKSNNNQTNDPSLDDGSNWLPFPDDVFGVDWNANALYNDSDVVRDDGDYWYSVINSNQGNDPSLDNGSNWVRFTKPVIISQNSGTLTQAVADKAENGILCIDNDVSITSEIVLNNVNLIFAGNSKISGSGSIRGVLINEEIPTSGIRVAFNLDISKNRNDTVDSGDFYLDPLLGDDSNNGTSSSTPVKTLSQLRTLINTEIALAADNPIVAIVRSGRVEVTSQIDFDTSQSTASVTITKNTAEAPYLSGPLQWFIRSGATAINTGSTDIYALYAADLDNKQIPISHNKKQGGGLPRNQAQAVTVATNTCTLVVDADTAALLATSSNLTRARLKVTQSWSGSVYHGIAISGTNMTYTKPSSQTVNYYNGFDNGVNSGYAPYYIEGLDVYKTKDTWCNNGSTVSLPDEGNVFFAPTQLQQPLLISANNYILDGIPLMYHQPTKTNMEEDDTGVPIPDNGFLTISGNDVQFINSNVKHLEGNGVYADGDNVKIHDSYDNFRVGGHFFYIGDSITPQNVVGGEAIGMTGRYWGTNNPGAKAIQTSCDTVKVYDFKFWDGATQSIAVNNSTVSPMDIKLFRGRAWNLGMPEYYPDESFMVNDAGGIYYNGLSSPGNFQMKENAVWNVVGFHTISGAYIDNAGIGGIYFCNVMWGVKGIVFYNRNVSALTGGNTYDYNIWAGTVVCDDADGGNPGTWNKSVVAGKGGIGTTSIGSAVTSITKALSGVAIEAFPQRDFLEIRDLDALNSDGVTTVFNPIVGPLIQEMSFRPVYDGEGTIGVTNGKFTPLIKGTTGPGATTHTTNEGFWRKVGDNIYFWVTLVWSACTYGGNIRIDMGDIPYTPRADADFTYPCQVLVSGVGSNGGFTGDPTAGREKDITPDPVIAVTATGDIRVSGMFPI
jgi:hypothetical protein